MLLRKSTQKLFSRKTVLFSGDLKRVLNTLFDAEVRCDARIRQRSVATAQKKDWKPAINSKAESILKNVLLRADIRYQDATTLTATIQAARASGLSDKGFWTRVLPCVENVAESLSAGECLTLLTELSPVLVSTDYPTATVSRVRSALLNRLSMDERLALLTHDQLLRCLGLPVVHKATPPTVAVKILDVLDKRFKKLSAQQIARAVRYSAFLSNNAMLSSPFVKRSVGEFVRTSSRIPDTEFMLYLRGCLHNGFFFGEHFCRAVECELIRRLDSLPFTAVIQFACQLSHLVTRSVRVPTSNHCFEALVSFFSHSKPQLKHQQIPVLCTALVRLWTTIQNSGTKDTVQQASTVEDTVYLQNVNDGNAQASQQIPAATSVIPLPECYLPSETPSIAVGRWSTTSSRPIRHQNLYNLQPGSPGTALDDKWNKLFSTGTFELLHFLRWSVEVMLSQHRPSSQRPHTVFQVYCDVQDVLVLLRTVLDDTAKSLLVRSKIPALVSELDDVAQQLYAVLEHECLPRATYEEHVSLLSSRTCSAPNRIASTVLNSLLRDIPYKDPLQDPTLLSDSSFLRLFNAFFQATYVDGILACLRALSSDGNAYYKRSNDRRISSALEVIESHRQQPNGDHYQPLLSSDPEHRKSPELLLLLGEIVHRQWRRIKQSSIEDHPEDVDLNAVMEYLTHSKTQLATLSCTAVLQEELERIAGFLQCIETEDLVIACLRHSHASGSSRWLWEIQRRLERRPMEGLSPTELDNIPVKCPYSCVPPLLLLVAQSVAQNTQVTGHDTLSIHPYAESIIDDARLENEDNADFDNSEERFDKLYEDLASDEDHKKNSNIPAIANAAIPDDANRYLPCIRSLKPTTQLSEWFQCAYTFCFPVMLEGPATIGFVYDLGPSALSNILASIIHLVSIFPELESGSTGKVGNGDSPQSNNSVVRQEPAVDAAFDRPLPPISLDTLLSDITLSKDNDAEENLVQLDSADLLSSDGYVENHEVQEAKTGGVQVHPLLSDVDEKKQGVFQQPSSMALLRLTVLRTALLATDLLLLRTDPKVVGKSFHGVQERLARHGITEGLSRLLLRAEAKDLLIAAEAQAALRLPRDTILLRCLCYSSCDLSSIEEVLRVLRILHHSRYKHAQALNRVAATLDCRRQSIVSTLDANEIQMLSEALGIERLEDHSASAGSVPYTAEDTENHTEETAADDLAGSCVSSLT